MQGEIFEENIPKEVIKCICDSLKDKNFQSPKAVSEPQLSLTHFTLMTIIVLHWQIPSQIWDSLVKSHYK